MSLDPSLRRLFEKGGACGVSDACERAGVLPRIAHIPAMCCDGAIAGEVRTLRLRPARRGEQPGRHLGTALLDTCESGSVIVISAPEAIRAGSWGGLLLAAAANAGVVSVISDGYCRDVMESKQRGIALFCRGSAVLSARGRLVEQSYNEPIVVDREVVEPGEVVVADHDGQVFLSPEFVLPVAESLGHILSAEQEFVEQILSGKRRVSDVLNIRYEKLTQISLGASTVDGRREGAANE